MPRAKRAFYVIWAIVDIALLLFFFGFITWYLINGIFVEKRTVARIGLNLGTHHDITGANQAEALVTSDPLLFASGDRFDYVAEIENGNDDWYADFRYYFKTAEGTTDFERGFVLPGEKKVLASIGQDIGGRNADLVIEDLTWHRIDAREVGDADIWFAEHRDIEILDVSHGAGAIIGDQSLIQTTFSVINNSPYSYWTSDFYVVLRRGKTIVGVNKVQLAGLVAGEERDVKVNWFNGVPAGATADVEMSINFFDEDLYMPNPEDGADEILDFL